MSERIRGLEAAYALFNALPQAAQAELATTLGTIADEALEIQESLVPVRTGDLKAALTIDKALEALRVRVGLLGKGRSKVFYGRIVEFGRRAQTVRVIRGTIASVRSYVSKRRRARAQKLRKAYLLRVPAMAARPFVHIESRIDAVAARYMADFWDRTLNRSAGA